MNLRILAMTAATALVTSTGYSNDKWSVRMTDSEMARYPESWMLDFSKKPKWGYCQGLETYAIYQVYKATGDKKYLDYVRSFGDTMLLDNGKAIRTYDLEKFNIDNIAGGKTLITLYRETGEEKYKNAADLLREQMRRQPRTSEGGFWHKQIYPHQMWLDGLFMASPFLMLYGKTFDEPALYDEVTHQLLLVAQHTRDSATGLFYHGWDESREQRWANKETGTSPNFWSRSMGWYMMALVDVLEYLPAEHPKRGDIINILKELSVALEKQQDPESKAWYQVTNMGTREGNYLESSGTAMFGYAWAKAATNGWLDRSYLQKAQDVFDGMVRTFITVNDDKTINLTKGCVVSGLGGSGRYRDGSFEYYISEPVRDNDPKAVAPFILLALLLEKAGK
ncbi:MAG: glycoside hydrolase family 88 protein [Prevotellaceae bacterium]|jgi:unsaturated rhamnogalacturonyl hydrolase|nr:glycoside hydrolase family 88 protein [Prevotellaceae bacterium]